MTQYFIIGLFVGYAFGFWTPVLMSAHARQKAKRRRER